MTDHRVRRAPIGVALLAGLVAVPGCGPPRPRAPALKTEPVFQDEQEGFRFLVPSGWTLHVRAALPPGPVEKERLIATFRWLAGDHPAEFDVSRADLPRDADLSAFWTGQPRSGVRWRPKGSPEAVMAGAAAATRLNFGGRAASGPEMADEVVAVRRGSRVYFFAATFAAKDETAREQARGFVASVIWKD